MLRSTGITVILGASKFERAVMLVKEPLRLSVIILDTLCWVMGATFIFGAIFHYLQHRYNPSQSPIGHSFFLSCLGLLLLLLPIIGKYALPRY